MVSLGTRVENQHEILSGLKGNEVLAAGNLNFLATGVSVNARSIGNMPAARAAVGNTSIDQGGRA